MKYKTKTAAITYGLFSILGLIVIIYGLKDRNLGYILIGVICVIIFSCLFILYLRMIGNTYFQNNEIINENIFGKITNFIDEKLIIKFGLYSIAIINKNKIYLDKENDTNNVIQDIYNYIKNNIQNETIIFPYLYKRDNYIISILNFVFSIIGVFVYINIYMNILLLLLSLLLFLISAITFIPNRKIIINNENITIYNFINKKKIILNADIRGVRISIADKKLFLCIISNNKKINIILNKKANKQNIKNIYLLENYYKEIIRKNGHST